MITDPQQQRPHTSLLSVIAFLCLSVPLMAQSAPPNSRNIQPSLAPLPSAENTVLAPLEQAAQTANADIARLRIEKWKTDSAQRQLAQANADSIQRNITAALPALIAAVRANPQDLAANFRLYRNLNALYEVLLNLGDAAGAFAGKSESDALAQDVGALDNSRRALGDYLDQLTAQKESELARYRSRVNAVAQQPTNPSKKVVIDDTPPASKQASRKKKSSATAPKPQ